MVDISGEICYALNNQVGSIEALYGADSATAAQARAEYIYSSYGEIMMKSGDLADKNNITYSTRYREGNTGLVGYTYRHYSPRLKKWLSKDPIAEHGGINLYQMVGNDPIGYWDVLGYAKSKCNIDVVVGHGSDDEEDAILSEVGRKISELLEKANLNGISECQYKISAVGCNSQSLNELAGKYKITPNKNRPYEKGLIEGRTNQNYSPLKQAMRKSKKPYSDTSFFKGSFFNELKNRYLDALDAARFMCKDPKKCCSSVNINIIYLGHKKMVKRYTRLMIEEQLTLDQDYNFGEKGPVFNCEN